MPTLISFVCIVGLILTTYVIVISIRHIIDND